MVEHLLQQEQAPGVIVPAHHHPVTERLPKRVCGHVDVQTEVDCDTLEDPVDGLIGQRIVHVAATVGLAPLVFSRYSVTASITAVLIVI